MSLKILGTGSYLPPKVVTNDDLAKSLDTSDEWIFSHTGIHARHMAGADDTTSSMAVKAARAAMESAGAQPDEIGLVIVATSTPDYNTFPSTACLVQDALGCKTAGAYDLQAACAGFVYALEQGRGWASLHPGRKVLVIGSETLTRVVDWNDRASCILFGDGAGAVLMEASEDEGFGARDAFFRTDGKGLPFLHMKAGGSVCPPSHFTVSHRLHYIYQEGRTVFRYAVTSMGDDVAEIMKRNGLTTNSVKWVVPHEANLRIIEAVAKRVNLPMEKVVVNIERYGNTSGATIPLALWDNEPKMKRGDNVILTAFGAGFTHGASYYKWAYDGDKVGK